MRILAVILACLLLAACGGYTTTRRETGYKGKAKVDAYLAASRFLERFGYSVESKPGWPDLKKQQVSMLFVPAEVISTEAYLREVDQWVADGGHLLCLVEWGESHRDEWSPFAGLRFDKDGVVPEALHGWLEDAGVELSENTADKFSQDKLKYHNKTYEIFAESHARLKVDGKDKAFDQVRYGHGLITVMADARPFRNRHIGDHDHAELLLDLANSSPYRGKIVIVRDAAISLWSLVWRHGSAVVIGILVVTLFWLWKNMPRFGPPRREEGRTTARDYDHHLEALGDFQWRLDKGAAMLRPLRDSVLERAQRMAAAGHRDGDLFEWIARRAGITRDRAERAMTHDRPPDPASFARLMADLQKIHLSLT